MRGHILNSFPGDRAGSRRGQRRPFSADGATHVTIAPGTGRARGERTGQALIFPVLTGEEDFRQHQQHQQHQQLPHSHGMGNPKGTTRTSLKPSQRRQQLTSSGCGARGGFESTEGGNGVSGICGSTENTDGGGGGSVNGNYKPFTPYSITMGNGVSPKLSCNTSSGQGLMPVSFGSTGQNAPKQHARERQGGPGAGPVAAPNSDYDPESTSGVGSSGTGLEYVRLVVGSGKSNSPSGSRVEGLEGDSQQQNLEILDSGGRGQSGDQEEQMKDGEGGGTTQLLHSRVKNGRGNVMVWESGGNVVSPSSASLGHAKPTSTINGGG
ncbi:unnamed protein product, partial [Choristocarpus tenellus]